LLSHEVERNMQINHMDVSPAFLHWNLAEEVYLKQPQGFHVGEGNRVCNMHQALYGLKQAPIGLYDPITGVFAKACLTPSVVS
jgi:Reverse transcriptase (RNA-dependent DNA polymerase)